MSAPPSARTSFSRGYLIALASAAILSTTAVFIRHLTLSYHMPALVLAFWRDVFVVALLLPLLALLRPATLRLARGDLWFFLAFGLVLAFFNSMWTLSVSLNGAAVATVLAYSSAAFTALLGWWLLKERLDVAKLLAIALCIGGCALVAGVFGSQAPAPQAPAEKLNLAGISVGVLSGLGYAIYSLMGRVASQRGLNPWKTLLYTFAFASLIFLAFNLLPGGWAPGKAVRPADLLWLGSSLPGWGFLILLAIGPTVAGFGLVNVSLTLLPASVVNLVLTSEPVFTTVIAFIFLGERLALAQIAGALLILSGVVLLRIYEGRQAPAAA